MLQHRRLGIAECLAAIRIAYAQPINEPPLLRALTYFQDAEREAPLPNEGAGDWETVKDNFRTRVGSLLVPPSRRLAVQATEIDVRPPRGGK